MGGEGGGGGGEGGEGGGLGGSGGKGGEGLTNTGMHQASLTYENSWQPCSRTQRAGGRRAHDDE